MTYVNFELKLNVTNLTIQIIVIFETVINPGIAYNIAAQFFLSTPDLATNTSWLVAQTLMATSQP